MSELSPAAKAIAKAALYVSSCDPEDYPNQAEEIAAAALRAAADQVVIKLGGLGQESAWYLKEIATELDEAQ